MVIKYCRISNVMYSRGRCGPGILVFYDLKRGYQLTNKNTAKDKYSIIDKYQHMHFFTFNTVLIQNIDFKVKIQ